MVDSRFVPIYLEFGTPFSNGQDIVSPVFRFDAVLSERHDITSTITEHPVEQGTNIADHVRPDPVVINIQGVITQTPIVAVGTDGWSRTPQILGPGEYNIVQAQPKDAPGTAPPVISPPQPPLGALLSLNGIINAASNALFGDGTFTLQQSLDRNTLPDQQYHATVDTRTDNRNFIAEALATLIQLRDQATLCRVVAPHNSYKNMVLNKVALSRASSEAGKATFDLTLQEIRIVQTATVAAPKPSITRAAPPQKQGNQPPVPPPATPQTSVAEGFYESLASKQP